MPLLGSSPPFTASSNMRKTLGPVVKTVIRPPAGTPTGPTCSFYCVLQYKIGLGLKRHSFFIVFGGGPSGPGETPKRLRRGLLAAMPPRGPQEAQSSPRGPLAHKRVTSVYDDDDDDDDLSLIHI